MHQSKKMLLRLDDGSLIGPSSVLGDISTSSDMKLTLPVPLCLCKHTFQTHMHKQYHQRYHRADSACPTSVLGGGNTSSAIKLTVDKAIRMNPPRAGAKDVARLERLIASVKTAMPHSSLDHFALEEHDSKRARVDISPITEADYAKCSAILKKCVSWLGSLREPMDAKVAFYKPVNREDLPDANIAFYKPVNKEVLVDYDLIVNNPICLQQIEEKLKMRRYSCVHDFSDDMKLLDSNCKLYNPENDPYRKVGDRLATMFEQLWVSSGMSGERGKRATAGVAAPKYDPEVFEPLPVPKASGVSKSGGKKAAGGEVSSGARGPKNMSQEHRGMIAEQLGELSEEHMEGLMQLLPPEMLDGADGEFELDFEALELDTLWKIDAFLKNIKAQANSAHQGFGDGGTGLRLEADSDAEDDNDPDDDSD
eukprot:gene23334-30582_t